MSDIFDALTRALVQGQPVQAQAADQMIASGTAMMRDKAKLARFAKALERAASALTGRQTKVKVERIDEDSPRDSFEQVAQNGKEIQIGVKLPLAIAADNQLFIRTVLGLYYHALTHVWFTPKAKSVSSQSFYNLLEDQRIESFTVALYPALAAYFRAAFAHMVAYGGVEPDQAYLLASGRKFLDPDFVAATREVCKWKDKADKIDAVIASYKKLHTRDMTTYEINRHIEELKNLVGWYTEPPSAVNHRGMTEGMGDSKDSRSMSNDAVQLIEEEDADSFDQTGGRSQQKEDSEMQPNGEGDGAQGGSELKDDQDADDDADDSDQGGGAGAGAGQDDDTAGQQDRPVDPPDSPVQASDSDPDRSDPQDDSDAPTDQPGAATDDADQAHKGQGDAKDMLTDGSDGDEDILGTGDESGDSIDAADGSGGHGASTTGDHDGDLSDEEIMDVLNDLLDMAKDSYDSEVNDTELMADDTRSFQDAMQGNARIDMDQQATRPVTPDMDETAHMFSQKMSQFMTPDIDPGWLRREPIGRINAQRFLMGEIEDYDEMFDTWEPGHTEAFQVSAAIMVDRSPSMGETWHAHSMIAQACRAAWVIRRGLEVQDAAVRTQFWSDGDDFVYVYGDEQVGRDYKLVETQGGTSPSTALADIEVWLDSRPDDENRLLFILTDGRWSDYIFSNPIIQAMRDRGILVVLVGLGMHPSGAIPADVTARVDSGDDFVKLAGDVMETLFRKISMTIRR